MVGWDPEAVDCWHVAVHLRDQLSRREQRDKRCGPLEWRLGGVTPGMARVARQASVPWIGCYKGEQARGDPGGDAQLHSVGVNCRALVVGSGIWDARSFPNEILTNGSFVVFKWLKHLTVLVSRFLLDTKIITNDSLARPDPTSIKKVPVFKKKRLVLGPWSLLTQSSNRSP